MFSIITPIFDPLDRFVTAGALQRSLENVFALEGHLELILVNNNDVKSCPQVTRYLRSLASLRSETVKIIEPNKNLGTARGFNAGLSLAKPDSQYFVFMSQDTDIVDLKILTKIHQILRSHPTVGIAHPVSVYEDSMEYNYSRHYNRNAFIRMIGRQSSAECAEISQAKLNHILESVSHRKGVTAPLRSFPLTFAIIKREVIEDIGSFDEGVEMGCHENNDLTYRALLAGYMVARLNGVFVNHRRLYFRSLVVSGAGERNTLPHTEALKQSTAWWNKKWGRPYVELYTRWRRGPYLFTLMWPYFRLRRLGGLLKRALSHW